MAISLTASYGGQKTQLTAGYERGAGEGNRTPDPRFTKPMLYRLSYAGAQIEKCSPDKANVSAKPAGEHFQRRIDWRTRPAI